MNQIILSPAPELQPAPIFTPTPNAPKRVLGFEGVRERVLHPPFESGGR